MEIEENNDMNEGYSDSYEKEEPLWSPTLAGEEIIKEYLTDCLILQLCQSEPRDIIIYNKKNDPSKLIQKLLETYSLNNFNDILL